MHHSKGHINIYFSTNQISLCPDSNLPKRNLFFYASENTIDINFVFKLLENTENT